VVPIGFKLLIILLVLGVDESQVVQDNCCKIVERLPRLPLEVVEDFEYK